MTPPLPFFLTTKLLIAYQTFKMVFNKNLFAVNSSIIFTS